MILEENKSLLLLVRPLLNLLLTCCTIIFSDPKHQVAIINFFKNQVAIKKSFLGQKFLSNSLLNLIRALLKVTGAQTEKAAIQITQKITASEDSSMQILHLWDDLPRLDSKESHYCELFFFGPLQKKNSWGGWGGVYYCELNIKGKGARTFCSDGYLAATIGPWCNGKWFVANFDNLSSHLGRRPPPLRETLSGSEWHQHARIGTIFTFFDVHEISLNEIKSSNWFI